ncbi:MAG: 7-carboxy-7-deazaguanine synthase QueE [Nitrospirales bacterium]|nr:7-carboxy-7-deazaguanine synthase QueE [Nitrospira sp.]MDR4500759.1 7-carboxy-7-deazaguanine synthase QueE [Nitrospirales bacterium]
MDVTASHLQITEIFHSIQGESSFAGQPCVFVRLTGCPLRCTWCDTDYAFYGGQRLSFETILERVRSYRCRVVEVTGGEPLSQPACVKFLSMLCDQEFDVLLETSGAIDTIGVDPRVHIILDVKCPGSGMEQQMHWANLERLTPNDEAKFVIKDRQDYEWAKDVIARYGLTDKCTVLLSPVFGELDLQPLAGWILDDRLPVRFQVQLHKYIWAPDMRGV